MDPEKAEIEQMNEELSMMKSFKNRSVQSLSRTLPKDCILEIVLQLQFVHKFNNLKSQITLFILPPP